MTTNIIDYTKTIEYYLFKQFDKNTLHNFLDNFSEYYQESLLKFRKIWATQEYLNSLILTFLTVQKDIVEKDSVFLALIFKYAFTDNYLASDVTIFNINYFIKFMHKYNAFALNIYKEKVLYFLTNSEFMKNDLGITENDFNLYLDILMYNQPVVYFDFVYTTYYYDETYKIINNSQSSYTVKNKETLQKGLIDILYLLNLKSESFNTLFFKNIHTKKIQKLNERYKGIV